MRFNRVVDVAFATVLLSVWCWPSCLQQAVTDVASSSRAAAELLSLKSTKTARSGKQAPAQKLRCQEAPKAPPLESRESPRA